MKYNKNLQRLSFFIMALVCFTTFANAQDDKRVQIKPNIDYTNIQPTYIIGGLTISPVAGYDSDLLKSISGLSIGQYIKIPGDEISDVVKGYWRQGLFSDVQIEADSIVGSKIYLHIVLKAHPRISRITFNGIKKSEKEELKNSLGLVVGSQVTADILDRAKIIIDRYFEKKGYKNVDVNIAQHDDVVGENKVLLDVNINKKQKIKVKHIYLIGVKKEEISKLKKSMKKTREVNKLINFLRSKKFLPEKYKEDKGFIIDKMNEWGYRDALIECDSVVPYDKKHVDIYIHIHEGPKYYIRNISWVGNTVYSSEALSRTLRMKHGDLYNQKLLDKRLNVDEDAIGNQYYNNGYVFYQLEPAEVNIVGDSIDLEMRISEGTQAHLSHIRINGNDRVYDNVIRRELRTKPGDLFNRDALMRSTREIASMGHFDPQKVSPDVKPNYYDGTVDINYDLVSKPSDQIELSAGWGQTGIVGKVALKFTNFSMKNLFGKGRKRAGFIPQGDGESFTISGQTNGSYYQSYSISYLDPWFGGKRPNQFSVSAFYSKQTGVNSNYYNSNYYSNYTSSMYGYGTSSNYNNMSSYYDPDTYVKMFGLSVGFGKRLRWPDDYFTLTSQLSYTRYMLRSWQYFIIQDGDCNNINLSLSLNRNSTDNAFFPRKGSEFSISVSATPPFSLWDNKDYASLAQNSSSSTYQEELQEKYRWIEYHKWKFKLKTYTSLTSKGKCPVLMTRTEFGLLGSYNNNKKSPFETFYVGGDGMSGYSTGYATETIGLRGYDNGCFTPYGSEGYAYSRMTLELRYPLMLDTSTQLYVLGFVEGGNAWNDTKDFDPFNMKRSAGVGVRIFLPMVGLMGIDWAYGFDDFYGSSTYSGSHFHFVLGQEF